MDLSGNMMFYLIFIIFALLTGIVFWVIQKYRIPAVISLIFALLAPLLFLLVAAQRDGNMGAYDYLLEQIGSGNSVARFLAAIHVYLIGWLLFLIIRGIVFLFQSPTVKETLDKWIKWLREKSMPQKKAN